MKVFGIIVPAMMIAALGLPGCSREDAVAPAQPGGVYRSESAGALFEQSVDIAEQDGEYIAQFPLQSIHRPAHNPEHVYIAAGEQGVVLSEDDGVSWRVIPTPLTFATDVVALANGVLVAAGQDAQGQGYVVRSLDAGVSWNPVFTVPVPVDEGGFQIVGGSERRPSVVMSLEPDPFNPERVYGGSSLGSLFIGEQSAKAWRTFYTVKPTGTAAVTGAKQTGISKIVVSPHVPGELLVITETKRLIRVADNKQTLVQVPELIGEEQTIFSGGGQRDVLDVAYISGFPEALLVGVDDGAVVTRDLGESWIELPVPVEATDTFNSAVVRTSPTNPNRIFAAINGVVYRSEDGGNTWNTFSFGLSNFAITDLSINPQNASKVLAVVRQLRV